MTQNASNMELVATHCAACGRLLVDAVSVETGMGPVCREKYTVNVDVDEASRKEANHIIYEIAARQNGAKVSVLIEKLRTMGFENLANRVEKRIKSAPVVTIEQTKFGYAVVSPYDPKVVISFRKLHAKFSKDPVAHWIVRGSKKAELWEMLKEHFSGKLANGPKGLFVIE